MSEQTSTQPWIVDSDQQTRLLINEVYSDFKDVPTCLYDFQQEGIEWMAKKGRCILGDDMGLGKTVQALMSARLQKRKRVLIVCPKTVRQVWAREIVKWLGPDVKYEIVRGTKMRRITQMQDQTNVFTICGYEQLRSTEAAFLDIDWDGFIFDEAHRLKSRKAQTPQSAMMLVRRNRMSMLHFLSGTPFLNRPDELFNMLNLVNPVVFSSYWDFVDTHMITYKTRTPGGVKKKVVKLKNPEAFKAMLAPYMLRRLKRDCLQLPEKTHEVIEVELEGSQRKMYESMRDMMVAQIREDREIGAAGILAQITRLKQIAVSHHLLEKGQNNIEGAKTEALIDLLEDVGEQKVVVFSQFADCVRRLYRVLTGLGYNCAILTGEQNDRERQEAIDSLQREDGAQIFLASTQAGGVGITLTAASIAVFMDLLWTPAMNAQAEDRLHRTGQHNPVTIYRIRAVDTIESWIEALLGAKQSLFDAAIPVESLAVKSLLAQIRQGDTTGF